MSLKKKSRKLSPSLLRGKGQVQQAEQGFPLPHRFPLILQTQNAAAKSDLALSPDEDDHLTIKKLTVQYSAQTPFQSSQPTQIATSTLEIINIEDFDEE